MLTWRAVCETLIRFFYLSARIVLHKKVMFMCLGIVTYYGILYALAVLRPNDGFSVEQALHILIEAPGTVLAIYLAMDLVAGERDKDTLEILFSTSASHYTTWGIRLGAVFIVLLLTILTMSLLAYFLFAEFPYLWGGLNAFLPAFFIGCLTFFFSTTCKSGNAAGMLSLGTLVVILLTAGVLENTGYFLFLNPLVTPMGVDEVDWVEKAFYNRFGIFCLGGILIFFALKKMENRERML